MLLDELDTGELVPEKLEILELKNELKDATLEAIDKLVGAP